MYIMLHESGDMVRVRNLTPSDLQAADDGLVDLLKVEYADDPKRYFDGEWHSIDLAEQGETH